MEAFKKWWRNLEFPISGGNTTDAKTHFCHKSPTDTAKFVWRAALEEVMDRTVDFELIQWIKKELEN